ncbi:MAG: AsmA family protein [Verrucomicrobiota bacterium]|nr:AsmA family protein [Verrucomicrobiota bacterium]
MKRILRWALYLCLALAVVILISFLSLDFIVKSVVQKKIRAATGMEARIGKFNFSFVSSSITLQNFKLINPPEFGGSTFVDIPELHLQMDRDALSHNQIHLKVARLNLAEIHVIENKDGKRNVAVLQKKSGQSGSTNRTETSFQFGGIDKLDVTIAKAKFTSFKNPTQNFERNLGIQNRVFTDLKTEKDLQNVGLVLAAQAGFNLLLEGILADPQEVLKQGSNAGKETKKVIEGITAPLKKP